MFGESCRGLIKGTTSVFARKNLRKTTENLSQDSRSRDSNLNLGPTDYEAGMLTTSPRLSILYHI
jgi:hypothetical protein